MPAIQGSPSPHRWNQIKRLQLHRGIETLEQYERAVLAGTLDAVVYLRRTQTLHGLTCSDLGQVHYQIFKAVHPWAGQFRRIGESRMIGSFPTADPQRITRDLELAIFQMCELVEGAVSAADSMQMLAALAFFHIRFERVHPFLDGNGRTGRAILTVQSEQAFGVAVEFTDQAGYREALRTSTRSDIAPFLNYLGSSLELPRARAPWPAPFRISPRFLEAADGRPTFEEDLAWSRAVS